MSHSVFKEYPSAHTDNGESKVDSNLMVFLNKDGSVSVDQTALQNLLINDAVDTKTSVTVIRMGSPTPSLELEIRQEEEERSQESQEDVDDDDEEEDEEEGDEDGKENTSSQVKEKIPHVGVTIEHFLVPEEAKQLASDILNIAGITNPLQVSVDYDFQRYVIANDHCYTPFSSPSQRNKVTPAAGQQTAQTTKAPSRKEPSKTKTKVIQTKPPNREKSQEAPTGDNKTKTNEASDEEEAESEEENDGSDSEDSYFSPSESENDRDSDLDFNLNDRPSRTRKVTKKKAKPVKVPRIARKRQSIVDTSLDTSEEALNSMGKKKPIKTTKKLLPNKSVSTPNTPATKQNKVVPAAIAKPSLVKIRPDVSVAPDVVPQKEDLTPEEKLANSLTGPPVPALAPISSDAVKQVVPPKRDRKPAAHVEALFSDMSSLFSTPDIIKKIGDTEAIPPPTPTTQTLAVLPAENQLTTQTVTATVASNKSFFIPIVSSAINNKTQTTVSGPVITVRLSTNQGTAVSESLASEQDKQLDLIDSIVQKELKESTPTITSPSGEDIPNIVKMLQNPEGVISTVMTINPNNPPITTTTTTQSIIAFTEPISHEPGGSGLLDDADLLDGLANAEDGLTEDLLQHVAKLVEDKNLQEVIDKQVLGVTSADRSLASQSTSTTFANISAPIEKTEVAPQPPPPVTIPINTTEIVNPPTTVQSAPTTPVQQQKGKEPIKIIRSDGRVITLPPIEAPTTRGAKRRAQTQGTPEPAKRKAEETLTPKVQTPKTVQTPKAGAQLASKSGQTPKSAGSRERRQSIAQKKLEQEKAAAQKKILPPTEADEDDEEEMDDDSDGSYNSEDDPYRLWCICRQPHNNRFMICCDKCEDWFHGKCVNVTKAMGMEMEERGVEWVCPNCIKKHQTAKKQTETKSTSVLTTPATPVTTATFLSCIVCKKPTRPNSIYCSDDCIRRHAQSTVTSHSQIEQTEPEKAKKQPSTLASIVEVSKSIVVTTPKTSMVSVAASAPKITFLKNKNRVVVMEKKTGRYLTGSSAPTVENLKQWLSEHPTFEIVPPNSAQAVVIKAKQQQLKQLAKDLQGEKKLFAVTDQKIQTTLKIDPTKKIILVNPQRQMVNDPKPQAVKPTTSKLIKLSQQQQLQLSQMKPSSPIKPTASGSPKTPVSLTPKTPLSLTPKTPLSLTPKASASATPKIPTSSPPKTPTSAPSKNQTAPLKTSTPVQKQSATSTASAATTSASSSQPKPQNKRKQTLEQMSSTPVSKNEPEPIRENVQRTLKAQLVQRSAETTDKSIPKLSDEEISQFAQETENEIFTLFNRDTGAKYRAKYRSLMFNIKDRKNQTLFHKICSKQIDAKQLVRMSAEEMASQELAMWRENETKHQLEMIKKSELDLLACAKSYVLKTHKGEEVIESKSTDRVTLDPSVSVEDVVSVLNNSTVSSTSENLLGTPTDVKDKRIDARFDRYLSVDSSSNTTKQNSTSSSSSSSVKKKEARRSRSRSRDRHDSKKSSSSKHKRRRSRDRKSRSRERDKSRQDRSERRDRSKEKDRQSGESSSKKKEDKRDRERTKSSSSKDSMVPSKKPQLESIEAKAKEPPKPLKKEDNYNLIDKILEAQSTIDRILHPEDQRETELHNTASKISPNVEPEPVKKMPSTESDQEPSSTVTIPTPPETIMDKDENSTSSNGGEDNIIWTGSIIMVDLATFRIKIQSVSGDCTNIEKEFPDELDIVGRINPDTVWDYIGKIKKSVNKEILILRFTEESADEREAYFTLYKYLYTRKRLGVIKTGSSCIKDFYVAPLAKHKSLPSILMPISGHGFENDRPDMLIGIIVKITSVPKRPVIPVKVVRMPTAKISIETKKAKTSAAKVVTVKDESFTPPGSPKLKFSPKVSLPAFTKTKENPPPAEDDGDEPYSPGGSDNDEDSYVPPQVISTPKPSIMPTTKPKADLLSPSQMEQDEIQRKMDELNRQIEAQKMEIAGMLRPQQPTNQGDEPYSPTSVTPPPANVEQSTTIPAALANISIPSNLKEILNSIKNVTNTGSVGDQSVAASSTGGIASGSSNISPSISAEPKPPVLLSTLLKSQPITIDDDDNDDEYTPMAVAPTSYNPSADYIPSKAVYKPSELTDLVVASSTSTSKLAQLSEEELLRLVPDDAQTDPPAAKKAKYTLEPAPPGLEDEYVP